MTSEWKEYSFGDAPLQILDGDRGKNYPKKSEFTEQGHCLFLNTGNVTPIGFVFSSNDFVSKKRDELLRKGKMQREDIVLTTRGTVGNVAYFDNRVPYDHIRINSGMVILRPDLFEILPRFLYLFLRSTQFKLQVEGLTTGSAQPQLPIRDIKRILITLPPLSEQKAIAHVLGSLDDKIELNRKMNDTLEAMAQTLFKSWFVDFDPVIDNIILKNSKKYPSPNLSQGANYSNPSPSLSQGARNNSSPFEEQGNEGSIFDGIPDEFLERAEARKEKLEETYGSLEGAASNLPKFQSFFSSEFVETDELGWIPKGWKIKALDDVANYQNGLALQKFRPEDENNFLPVLKIAQLRQGYAGGEEKASPNINPECIVNNGDVIFSWSGSLLVDIWCGGKVALNQHLFRVTSTKYPKWFYHYCTKHHLEGFQQIAADKAVTMGHIKREHLSQAYCAIPSADVITETGKTLDKLVTKQIKTRLESTSLVNLRDTLLPKLLSGEVRIPDAKTMIEEME